MTRWRNVRAIQLPSQTSSKIKLMIPDMINCCKEMIAYIKDNIKAHEVNHNSNKIIYLFNFL